MNRFVIRNFDENLKAQLLARARANGQGLAQEVNDILRAAVLPASIMAMRTRLRNCFEGKKIEFYVPRPHRYQPRPGRFRR